MDLVDADRAGVRVGVPAVSIHASSFHSWSDSTTMEPVAGGISWERSIGSAFIFHSWFALSSSYL